MAFVNERIPEADAKKYGLEAIDHYLSGGGETNSRAWTINRARDIYLRCVARGRDEESQLSTWIFYWKGALIWFRREALGVEKKPDGLRHARSRLMLTLPEHLTSRREEICQDLRDAFRTYGGGGIFSNSTDYVHDLEIEA